MVKCLSVYVIICLLSVKGASAASAYSTVILHPSGLGGGSIAFAISGDLQAGACGSRAALWSGTSASYVDLHPSGFSESYAYDVYGSKQVGGGIKTTSGYEHALMWLNTPGSCVDLHPSGFYWSVAFGIDGNRQVGRGSRTQALEERALLWSGTPASCIDLTPSGFEGAVAYDISGSKQVGFGYDSGFTHALLWSGTSAGYVDLHPSGFSRSFAQGISGDQKVGYGYPNGSSYEHALLWSGTANTCADLHPSGYISSIAKRTSATQQVGFGYKSVQGRIVSHALLWSGTATSCVDLHSFLPPGYSDSFAYDIDSSGNIVGSAETESGSIHAVVWVPSEPPLPPNEDIDGDGLLNGWEISGIDENGDGIIDLDLPALGANPRHKDLFVEVDAMTGRAPTQAALNRVVAAFATIPNSLVDNPDGMDGITLHIQLDETNIPLADWLFAWTSFDNVKNNRFGTATQRANANWSNIREAKTMVYRYCIFANKFFNLTTWSWGHSGLAEMPGNDFMVTLGEWDRPGGTEDQQVGTFMHEFGHTLNLHHGGDDDFNYKPNYHSVMNYHWQTPHINHIGWVLDYSRSELPTLDESNLNEAAGIGGASNTTVPVGPRPMMVVNENGPVDWNRDGDTWDTGVRADINISNGQVLTGYNDWSALWYRLSGDPYFDDGIPRDETRIPEEITYELYKELYETVNIIFDFDPDTINLQANGQYVTAYIELPEGFDISQIDVSSVRLNESVAALLKPIEVGDYDIDGIADLMVKFDCAHVAEVLEAGRQVVTLTGRLADGTLFAGLDTIRVMGSEGTQTTEAESDLAVPQEVAATEEKPKSPKDAGDTNTDEALEPQEAAGFMLLEACQTISELGSENFDSEESAFELTTTIDAMFAMLDDGLYFEALVVLDNDILQRIDGCANAGQPDEDDWITSVEGQALVYPLVIETMELLESII